MNDSSSRYILTIVSMTIGILIILSVMPLSRLTNNTLKDFNLFEDLFPSQQQTAVTTTSLIVDPELEALMSGSNDTDNGAGSNGDNGSTAAATSPDSTTNDSVTKIVPVYVNDIEAPVIDGSVAIENYGDEEVLKRFRAALVSASVRTVRIAVIGDSYIEGDIFCSKLRDILQQRYGGSGIGFTAVHSDFPGFRQTVGLKSNGWKMHDIRNMSRRDTLRTLSSDYGIANGASRSTFNGRSKYPTTESWQRARFVFLAPAPGNVTISGGGQTQTTAIEASPYPQCVEINATMTNTEIKTDIPGLVALGTYLDSPAGVQVDCMSIRGNSGLATARINRELCQHMARWADYDLIILEFGMNVVNAEQKEYSTYTTNMVKAVNHLRSCYPNADILIMGVGDRGVKVNGEIESLPTLAAMTKAQRDIARQTGTPFWDTRSAMGGDKAVAEWRKRNLLNADYIHLNHAGGEELAKRFDKALQQALDE